MTERGLPQTTTQLFWKGGVIRIPICSGDHPGTTLGKTGWERDLVGPEGLLKDRQLALADVGS